MASAHRSLLPLSIAIALLANLVSPTLCFRVSPLVTIKKHDSTFMNNLAAQLNAQQHHPSTSTRLNNSREEEMMEQALREQEFRQVQQETEQTLFEGPPKLDPLIASLTRIDEPTPANVPTTKVPLFGEVPADDNLAVLAPVAAVSVLGFIYSIVVAFSSRDSIVQEMSKVELPKMEYTPTVVKEGECRGLCSSQDEDLDGLRNFMQGISGKK
mmetsp:Transcript_7647/g.16653  ORF Transcript_7647/g.16653 Transcript_7647/m.16653 type:complete len:213 (-) Transcript_7647:319-957(-)